MPNVKKIFENLEKEKSSLKPRSYRPWNFDETLRNTPSKFLDELNSPPLPSNDNASNLEEKNINTDNIQVTQREHLDNTQETFREHSDNNLDNKDSKGKSIGNDRDNIQVTQREHLDNTQETFREHSDNNLDNKDSKGKSIGNDRDNIQVTQREHLDNTQETFREHSDNNLDNALVNTLDIATDNNYIKNTINSLTGIQYRFFEKIVDLCLKNDSTITGPINTHDIASIIECSYGTLKTSIVRLAKKGLIIRLKGKSSHGGYINIKINPQIKRIWLSTQKKDKQIFIDNNLGNTLDNNPDSALDNKKTPIYNSNNKLNITINKKEPYTWESINISPLEEHGFKSSHIMQLKNSNNTTPEIVQESINHMAFGLKTNKDTQKYESPIKVLLGVLKKGEAWIEEKYADPKDESLQRILEHRKKQLESRKKIISDLKELEFNNWFEELNNDNIVEILKESEGGQGSIMTERFQKEKKLSEVMRSMVRNHFENNEWKKIKQTLNIPE